MKKVLFVCIHNSARSQMAEAFLKYFASDSFIVESAGIEPGKVNPLVIQAMAEIDIDISENKANSVMDFYRQGRQYDIVITVCEESASGKCPIFPGESQRYNWPFDNPSKLQGTEKYKLSQIKRIRDEIKAKVLEFIALNALS